VGESLKNQERSGWNPGHPQLWTKSLDELMERLDQKVDLKLLERAAILVRQYRPCRVTPASRLVFQEMSHAT